MDKVKKVCFYVNIALILGAMTTASCSKAEKPISYKKLEIQGKKIEHISLEPPYVIGPTKVGHKIFLISKGVWLVDLDLKKERLIIKTGIGPDEVYNPMRIIRFNDEIYVNSYYQLNYLCHFSTDSDNFKPDRINFDHPLDPDDFDFVSDRLMVMTRAYWETGYVRFYDLKSKKTVNIGKSKITDIMLKFNVNRSSLCVLADKVYVVQATRPEIMEISIPGEKISNTYTLSPPFYKPMPKKYNVLRHDDKNHKKWMSSWTSIDDIRGNGDWLLVSYRWGYDRRFCYELIDTNDVDHRYFIEETPCQVYDFEVHKNRIDFDLCELQEDRILWQHAQAYL
jgi:hypothetical protein